MERIQQCHPRGPMSVIDNRTTRKDNNKYQTTNIIYNQNSISIIKEIITTSNPHQIKPKRNNLTKTSLEKNGTCPQCDWLIGRQKEQKGAKVQNTFLFLKKNYFH